MRNYTRNQPGDFYSPAALPPVLAEEKVGWAEYLSLRFREVTVKSVCFRDSIWSRLQG